MVTSYNKNYENNFRYFNSNSAIKSEELEVELKEGRLELVIRLPTKRLRD